MIFTSMTQWAVLGLMLILGLCLGFIMAPRGTKWRTRYEAERDAHAAYRNDAEAKARERESLTTNRDAYVHDLEKAKVDLTAENERLAAENAELRGRPLPPAT